MYEDNERCDLPSFSEFIPFGPAPGERCLICAEPVQVGMVFGSDNGPEDPFWAVLCPCCVGWGLRAVYWAKAPGY